MGPHTPGVPSPTIQGQQGRVSDDWDNVADLMQMQNDKAELGTLWQGIFWRFLEDCTTILQVTHLHGI